MEMALYKNLSLEPLNNFIKKMKRRFPYFLKCSRFEKIWKIHKKVPVSKPLLNKAVGCSFYEFFTISFLDNFRLLKNVIHFYIQH